ncbi:endocuticle structural glycoprotein ABD-4-like [Culicoides brevitarsis]|uniref:endocuticle structural glycoprotein ABD-4-like n=1 Tax=Culicoides brevitarsis TaxID=469753 RepID=UPI00307B8D7E
MKSLIIAFAVIAVAIAKPQRGLAPAAPAPPGSEAYAETLAQDFNIEPDGSYQSSYQTSNGIAAQESGTLKQTGNPEAPTVVVASGSFSYTSPEGEQIQVNYVADDEGGYQPQGAHLPTPPPIPPAIARALEYLQSLPQRK